MSEVFPDPIKNLPEADIPLEGSKAYLSQSDTHQIIFMEFKKAEPASPPDWKGHSAYLFAIETNKLYIGSSFNSWM